MCIRDRLPVVPPSVRPSVRQYNSQRSEDDLTNKYYEIIKSFFSLTHFLSCASNFAQIPLLLISSIGVTLVV